MPAGNNSVTESKPRKIALRPTLTQQDGPFLCCRRRRCLGSRPLTKKEPTARHCHAFVSYLEEEAVKTYTHAIQDIDTGKIPEWKNLKAPELAIWYWRLPEGADMRDLLLAVRADEACHNHVNAVLADLKPNDPNPFAPGTSMIH